MNSIPPSSVRRTWSLLPFLRLFGLQRVVNDTYGLCSVSTEQGWWANHLQNHTNTPKHSAQYFFSLQFFKLKFQGLQLVSSHLTCLPPLSLSKSWNWSFSVPAHWSRRLGTLSITFDRHVLLSPLMHLLRRVFRDPSDQNRPLLALLILPPGRVSPHTLPFGETWSLQS